MTSVRRPSEERIFSKIVGGSYEDCWAWTGGHTLAGYGKTTDNGRAVYLHRWMYEYFRAEIPEGLQIDHLCRNRACCNPWHLEPVTCRENVHRAPHTFKDSCVNGHPLVGYNLYVRALADGQGVARACRQCRRDQSRAKKVAA